MQSTDKIDDTFVRFEQILDNQFHEEPELIPEFQQRMRIPVAADETATYKSSLLPNVADCISPLQTAEKQIHGWKEDEENEQYFDDYNNNTNNARSFLDPDMSILTTYSVDDNVLQNDRINYRNMTEQAQQARINALSKFELLESAAVSKPQSQFESVEEVFRQVVPIKAKHDDEQPDWIESHQNRHKEPDNSFDLADYEYSLVDSSMLIDHSAAAELAKSLGKHDVNAAAAAPSKLMKSFFPALANQSIVHEVKEPAAVPRTDLVDENKTPTKHCGAKASDVKNELELEMLKYREMNSVLKKAKDQHDQNIVKFHNEKVQFEETKQREIETIRRRYEEELKRLDQERKLISKRDIVNSILPNKVERLQIDGLKFKISKLEEDLRNKDMKHKLAMDRMKTRTDDLTRRNQELEQEVKSLQADRLKNVEMQNKMRVQYEQQPVPARTTKIDKQPLIKKSNSAISIASVNKENSAKQHHVVIQHTNPIKVGGLKTRQHYLDGRIEHVYSDGSRVVQYSNGSVKESQPNGLVNIIYPNGDRKVQNGDSSVEYYFADTGIKQTTLTDGTIIYDFPDGQVEKQSPNGKREIIYKDGTQRYILPNGEEECIFTDGTISRIDSDGRKVVEFSDGAREVYWDDIKQRFEVDGTIRTVYPDGTKESKYPDGTVKRLIPEGNQVKVVSSSK